MSAENSMANEIIALKEKLAKLEQQNAELMKQNIEMKEQIAKFVKESGTVETEKFNNNQMQMQPIDSNPICQEMLEEESMEFEKKMDAKRAELAEIDIPNWLIEVLKWIKRVEMADSKLSTSNWTFKQLCWPKLHQNVKPYKVNELYFRGERNEMGIYQAKLGKYRRNSKENIPIACIPPPNYIIGFAYIQINFLDGRVMQFIECIQSKFEEDGIILKFTRINIQMCHTMEQISQLHCLFEKLANNAISFCNGPFLDSFRYYDDSLQPQIGKIGEREMDIDLLVQWLNKARPDQKPKFLKFMFNMAERKAKSILIDRIKEQFIGATQCANFLIPFRSGLSRRQLPNFIMENELTGEVLTLYTNQNANQYPLTPRQILIRHPKGQEHLRAIWEEQLQQLDNLPYVHVEIAGIGEF